MPENRNWTNLLTPDEVPRPEEVPVVDAETGDPSAYDDTEGKVTDIAKRKYIQSEDTVMVGTIQMREANPKLISKKPISLVGLGVVVSGLYYVEKVRNIFDGEGYTQEIEVTRRGLSSVRGEGGSRIESGGDMVKSTVKISKSESQPVVKDKSRPTEVVPKKTEEAPVVKKKHLMLGKGNWIEVYETKKEDYSGGSAGRGYENKKFEPKTSILNKIRKGDVSN